ncbi:MAG: HAMP domain-containing protein [Gammaproteobacteria bacterium]|nr:HAMP domain-containing protein [Gammaproteobacteria bacterium]
MWHSLFGLKDRLDGNSSINKRLSLVLLLVLSISSVAFLSIVLNAYRIQLQKERGEASFEVSEVLRSALENAMLKRDLEGLQQIVDNMAKQSAITRVSILNRQGEIRFSSEHALIESEFPVPLDQLCEGCEGNFEHAQDKVSMARLSDGTKILRTVNPVSNRGECFACHGSVEVHPVNGILVVDYDASSIQSKAMTGMFGLSIAGIVVIAATVGSVWFYTKRQILTPVAQLSTVSAELASGNLSARAPDSGGDELAKLGKTINNMADSLQSSIKTIQKNEEYLQTLIDANPDGIRVIDSNYRIIKYNKAYEKLLGPNKASLPQCYASSHGRNKPCVPTLVTCPLHEIKNHGSGAIKTVQVFRNESGSPFETQVYSAPLYMQAEHAELFIVQSIRDLRHDIQYSQEQRLSSLGQLAAGVGHEIMNPLTSIRLALQSTLNNLHSRPDSIDDSIEYLELVDGEIDRCIDVTNRLRKLSMLPDKHLQIIDVNNAIVETTSLLKFEAEQANVRVTLQLCPDTPRALASESDIRIVILNLVQNAYHAMPDGGNLTIKTLIRDQQVNILFKDTGIGIDAADLPQIFNPFFSHRADGNHGMGLGLSICLSIIEQHHGQITVQSSADNEQATGTEFSVTLPLAC